MKNTQNKKFKIIDYLKIHEQKAKKIYEYDFSEDSNNIYIKTTFISCEVTIERIKQSICGQLALEILETIAHFASDNIPTKTFIKPSENNSEKVKLALELLAKYSMINLESEGIHIHRLVQRVMRLKLKEHQRESESLRKAMNFVITPINDRDAHYFKYLPHALSAWNYGNEYNNIIIGTDIIDLSKPVFNELRIYN